MATQRVEQLVGMTDVNAADLQVGLKEWSIVVASKDFDMVARWAALSGSMDWKMAGSMADWTASWKVGSWAFSKGGGSAG